VPEFNISTAVTGAFITAFMGLIFYLVKRGMFPDQVRRMIDDPSDITLVEIKLRLESIEKTVDKIDGKLKLESMKKTIESIESMIINLIPKG